MDFLFWIFKEILKPLSSVNNGYKNRIHVQAICLIWL